MRMKKPRRKLNIKMQFFLTYICIAVITAASSTLFFYDHISEILLERETSSFHELAGSFITATESEIQSMDDISINIGYSNLIQDRLKEYFDLDFNNIEEFSALVELFVIINGAEYKVPQMRVYDNSGKVISIGTNTDQKTVDLSKLSWVEEANEKDGHKYISQPYKTYDYVNNTRVNPYYFSLYRTFNNQYRVQTGYIEVIQSCKSVFKEIISYTKKNPEGMQIYVYNENGVLIYPFELEGEESRAYDNYYELANQYTVTEQVSDSSLTNPITGEEELVTFEKSSYTEWTYVCAQSKASIVAPIRSFRMIVLMFGGIILLLAIGISYFMANRLTRPIHQILDVMGQTKIDTLGHLQKDTMRTSFNEFDTLNDAFHQMSADLKNSMDELLETRQQEMKSRSLALQSQMNPHFYYNSLASIIILSENGQNEEVIMLCRNLSNIMRYITKSGKPQVTLDQEMIYVASYLQCMKVRYQSSLIYEIDIPESLVKQTLPKLIIQPLVENALKYGTDCTPPWKITVRGEKTTEYWKITVEDTGKGFSEEALALIRERIEKAGSTQGMPDIEINGMGLLNVYIRWHLFCSDRMIFDYGNKPEGGSYVTFGCYTNATDVMDSQGEE